jgi:kumamolisin
MKESAFIALPGSERVPVPGAHAVAAADAEAWLEVTVKLARRAPLPALAGRPPAHLTRAELADRFGAAPADLQRVADALAGFGLVVLESDAATRSVKLGGQVSAMEEAFQVKLMKFQHAAGSYRGRVGALHVPASIAGVVEGVFGLDDRRVAHRRPGVERKRLSAQAHRTGAKSRPWFFPAELAAAYDFPEGDGSGQTIGLIEFGGGFLADDLAAFVKQAGVPETATVVPVSVDHMPTDTNDDAVGEVMLDVEVVAGICPKATIPVYFAPFTEKGWVDVLDAAVHDATHQPDVLSISWGYAEDAYIWTAAAVKQVNEALHEAALLGLTVCVAAGDDGSSDGITDGHAHVDFPASSPCVLAVGGTLLRNGARRSERAWKDGDGLRSDGGGATGGGVSTRVARPDWQAGLDIAPVNPGQDGGRIVPDVAANASANTGYFTVSQGQAGITGGTSASAPLWAALIARMNQQLKPAGKRVGFLTPLLYGPGSDGRTPLASQQGFNDIHSGDNISAKVGGFKSRAGYDAVTGWGTPKGKELLAALAKVL